jgi:hypothetical protein
MNCDDRKKPVPHGEKPASGEPPHNSGEGADTALQALIRKRKMAETPDDPAPQQPPHP